MGFLPPTSKRVQFNTSEKINERLALETQHNIEKYRYEDKEEIMRRLEELDQEWYTERVLEASASSFVLLGTFLGLTSNKRWHLLSGVVGYFLLQHSLQCWCPPLPLIRGLGIRTANEINEERNALQTLLH
ncbi:hypothetical protein AJ85_00880 [Alkalihalobacillus alcalophilus ATCC 27647 = CGMCC 1.3604]|uniref:DUF2892 domain-containing protein n=1 Tax=Alkalihalobacillus alcalophilus ATCC 27647 = CGMCC 1.3604 TaxID=1218173 RepID=A0A094WG14_ALKAL|nr:DUF2892 domain-containing protein [Alkalihalobacillus alcalophilus]KGA96709.1 hypothetical protein BALCAV_0214520 [Alkalihalobacillus alcalophilus ATCC 27647 = CGMCC 1.3604]MED1561736.1 DUF2892 domain-containing protein [Alkalihalobacillus alcalophilus]THG91883.1 hypothetical protein AJ85_00880 [Alkalihalobacillus alcalophilus ATCC 27647 = CGMCC 1.3604]